MGYDYDEDEREHPFSTGIYLACLFFTFLICGAAIMKHCVNLEIRQIQIPVISILCIFPAFAICSVLGLVFLEYQEAVNIGRDLITFFGLYAFLELIIAYMSLESVDGKWVFDEENFYRHLSAEKQVLKHLPFVRCCCGDINIRSPIHAGVYMYKMRLYILQGCFIKPLFATLVFILDIEEDSISAVVTVSKILTLGSTLLTLYFILFIYQNFKTELAYTDPHGKFLNIKFGFFLATVQTLLLHFAAKGLDQDLHMTKEEGVYAINNWLIAIENLIIAFYACRVYGYKDFQESLDHKSAHDPLMKSKREVELTTKTQGQDGEKTA